MIKGMILSPAYTYPDQLATQLRQQGYAVLSPQAVCEISGCELADLKALRPQLGRSAARHLPEGRRPLPPAPSLLLRRRGRGASTQAPHRAHWQPVEYNALHGGMQRWFEPMEPAVAQPAAWRQSAARSRPGQLELRAAALVCGGAPVPHRHRGRHRPAHAGRRAPRRRRLGGGVPGRPRRHQGRRDARVRGRRPGGQRFTLTEPWSLLLLDDERVIHESTPIQPVGAHGYRDTLVLTCRADGFQGS